MANKKFDAFFLDELAVNYWVLNTKNQLRLLGEPINIGGGYAIVAKKNQQLLIQKINQTLLDMSKNGGDTEIFKNYF